MRYYIFYFISVRIRVNLWRWTVHTAGAAGRRTEVADFTGRRKGAVDLVAKGNDA